MIGVIRKRDVLAHPIVTIECFGWQVFLKTLLAGRNRTFLSVLVEAEVFEASRSQAPEPLQRCIRLEELALRVYELLARRFSGNRAVHEFFLNLALQEREHAELLELCREASVLGGWDAGLLDPFAETARRLEQQMGEAEASLDGISTLADALQLVVKIEASEVNLVFQGILEASPSKFVKKMQPFHTAVRSHLSYICRCVREIEPSMEDACRVLQYSI